MITCAQEGRDKEPIEFIHFEHRCGRLIS